MRSVTHTSIRMGIVMSLAMLLLAPACSRDSYTNVLHAMLEKERLVDGTRLNLLLGVEAEKNAMLSSTMEMAASFVQQARQAMSTARENLSKLSGLIAQAGEAKEVEALASVTADFTELAVTDAAILQMVGRNTNLRASLLSHTEAAKALARFEEALAPVADGSDCPASRQALRAEAEALAILALHAPHIEEKTDSGMDKLETAMHEHEGQVDAALAWLTDNLSAQYPGLAAAKAAYGDFCRLTQEILRLSRENSNINAMALVMGRKRLQTAKALDDLAALHAVVSAASFKATR